MSSDFAWLLLGGGVQIFVSFFFARRIGKGRLFSRPFRRLPPFRGADPVLIRISQLIALVPICFSLKHGVGLSGRTVGSIYWLLVIALYLDDYLTGDDDKWKKFWEGVKNKVKWKMKLPQPAEPRVTSCC